MPKRILVAPLNWGLGHVSRCVPLIEALQRLGAEVILASDGAALRLLQAEFPDLPSYSLPSYNITYRSANMVRNIGPQLPRLLWAVRAEQWVTRRLVQNLGIHGILSDNRYGCFTDNAHCVLLSHQLNLRIPGKALSWAANRMLKLALSKFDAVWVPDAPGDPNLSGELSHGHSVHPDVRFIGILSRFTSEIREPEYDVAVVLSGPEPQRTYLEQLLLEQAVALSHKFIFIQGKTRSKQHYFASDNIEVVSFLTSRELNNVLLSSRSVVCRSGYSSLMDLAVLGKKALLIPTPGQTEQEYLADYFAAQRIFITQPQHSVNLAGGLAQLEDSTGFPPGIFSADAFMPVLESWLNEM